MTDINEFIPIFLAMVFVAGLIAIAWAHWYSRNARQAEGDLEDSRRPAE